MFRVLKIFLSRLLSLLEILGFGVNQPTRTRLQMDLRSTIEAAWDNRELLKEAATQDAIRSIIADLDTGKFRVASPSEDGEWTVNDWIKKAVILYFPIQKM